MSLILLKTFHYLAILFAGGVLVGGGLIQAIFARANQVPDSNVSRVLKILGYFGPKSNINLRKMKHFRRAKRAGKFWILGSKTLENP